jgi:hypothetical protein
MSPPFQGVRAVCAPHQPELQGLQEQQGHLWGECKDNRDPPSHHEEEGDVASVAHIALSRSAFLEEERAESTDD